MTPRVVNWMMIQSRYKINCHTLSAWNPCHLAPAPAVLHLQYILQSAWHHINIYIAATQAAHFYSPFWDLSKATLSCCHFDCTLLYGGGQMCSWPTIKGNRLRCGDAAGKSSYGNLSEHKGWCYCATKPHRPSCMDAAAAPFFASPHALTSCI
jgi:hypothetical protein